MAIPKKVSPPDAKKQTVKHPIAPESTVSALSLKKENQFVYITLATYIIIGLSGVFRHVMWRDELQVWLIGVSSHSIGSFLHNFANEYNPLGWYLIDFVLSRFTDSPVIADVFHFLISAGSIYLILKYAPFSRLQKVLLCFSYYLLFEYSIIARGYSLTVFFTFLFCAFYQTKSKYRYLLLALILVCLANGTAAHGIIIATTLLGMMVVDYYYTEDVSIRKKYSPTQLFIGVITALIGFYIAYKCISPPSAGSDRANTWFWGFDGQRLRYTLYTFWMSFIPIPNVTTINFWNTNIFLQKGTNYFIPDILFFIFLIISLYCTLLYSKKISVVLFYLGATVGILLFTYTNNVIYILLAERYYGFLFIVFIATVWLGSGIKKSKVIIPGFNSLYHKLKVEKNFKYILTGVLAVNALGGLVAFVKAYSAPFSSSKSAGDYIVSHHLDKLPETGFIDYAVSPISAYTKQPIYFPDRDTISRYTCWGNTRFSLDMNVLLNRTLDFISHQHDSVLFICNSDCFGIGNQKVIGNILFTRIASFYGAVLPDENYILYIAKSFDINKQLQDTASWNTSITSSILSYAYDLIQQDKLDAAEKILTTVKEKAHGTAIPHLHSYLGMLYSKKNMTADAEKEFMTEITLNLQKEEAFFNLGMLYFQNKDYKNAIISWDSTVNIDPKNANALNNLGVCFLNFKGDNNQAKVYFEKALDINPNYMQGYYNLLVCAQNTNDEEMMIKYIRILLDKGASISDIRAKGINISDDLLKKISAR